MVVGQFHGILTGQSSPTWPTFGTGFFEEMFPEVETVNSKYFALPLPRIEALRNTRRSRELAMEMECIHSAMRLEHDSPPVSIVSHSNGAVLSLQVARTLIARGVPIRALVMIAPALRTGSASREIAGWLDRGMLDYALLVRPTRDIVIGGIAANWRTKLYAWPWGSLGHDGWSVDVEGYGPWVTGGMQTIDLPDMGHSEPVAPHNREWLYREIVCPALGLVPWGDIERRREPHA
jgi:hypothetical protein